MAIKTKKIQDLGDIVLTDKNTLEKSDVYLVGSQSGITGKISTKELLKINSDVVSNLCEKMISELKTDMSAANDNKLILEKVANTNIEISSLKTSFAKKMEEASNKVKTLETTVKQMNEIISAESEKENCNCDEKIAALESKISALEGFVQALQKDGYLTLAEIRKAASEACPICNHTHEEQSSAE